MKLFLSKRCRRLDKPQIWNLGSGDSPHFFYFRERLSFFSWGRDDTGRLAAGVTIGYGRPTNKLVFCLREIPQWDLHLRRQAAAVAIRFGRLGAHLPFWRKTSIFFLGEKWRRKPCRRCDNWLREAYRKIVNVLGRDATYVTCRRGDIPKRDLPHVIWYSRPPQRVKISSKLFNCQMGFFHLHCLLLAQLHESNHHPKPMELSRGKWKSSMWPSSRFPLFGQAWNTVNSLCPHLESTTTLLHVRIRTVAHAQRLAVACRRPG